MKYKDVTWMVKGVEHPEGFAVAFPRYVGNRKVSDTTSLSSILNLVRRCDCAPRPVPLVPLSKAIIMNPLDLIEADKVAKDFASILPKGAGLTGSRVVGIEGDLDLVYYNNFERVIKALREMRESGETEPPKWGKWDSLGSGAVEYRSREALLEGEWRGYHYSIRLVGPNRAPTRPSVIGARSVRGVIVEAQGNVMPYVYQLDNGIVIESLRMQHSELKVGMEIEVRGSWELSTLGERLHLGLGSYLNVISY